MNSPMLDNMMSVVLINNLSSVMPGRQGPSLSNASPGAGKSATGPTRFTGGSMLLPNTVGPENANLRVPPPSPVIQSALNGNAIASQIQAASPDKDVPSFGIPDLSPDTLRQIAWMDGNPNDLTLYDISMYMNGQIA